jgi:hypothetical protein
MAGVDASAIAGYPKDITDAVWQKKKGLIGKATKTGLGAELLKCEALHKKIDVAKLDVGSNAPKSQDDIDTATKEAKAHYAAAVEPLRKQLLAAKGVAEAAQATLKKKVGGGDAAKAAGAIADSLGNFAVTCKSIDLDASIAKAEERVAKLNMLAAKLLNESLKKFLVGYAKFKAGDGSKASWDENIKQNGRSVSNSIKQLDQYRDEFWSEFVKFQGFDLGTLGMMDDDDKSKDDRKALAKKAAGQVKEMALFKP